MARGVRGNVIPRILLVEDNVAQADLFIEGANGRIPRFSFQHVRSLAAATEALTTRLFDLVVLDLGLPDSVGIPTLDAIIATGVGTPIVVLSNDSEIETGLKALDHGAIDYLVKGGSNIDQYERILLQVLEKARLHEEVVRKTEEVQAFTYGLTHDLRSPLVTMDFLIEDAREELAGILANGLVADGPLRSQMEMVMERLVRTARSIEAMAQGIDDVLAYGRVTTTEGVWERVVLADLLEGSLKQFSERARKQGARVVVDTGPGASVELACDSVKMAHLISNLVENALKYGVPAGGVVRVACHPDGSGFTVEDDGPGIPADERRRVFEPYTRGAKASLETTGSGLGLATALRVAEAHGARLVIEESELGGACFNVTFAPESLRIQASATTARAPATTIDLRVPGAAEERVAEADGRL